MQHLLPIYLVVCILPGIAALTVLSVLASRLRNSGLILYLIAYSCFTINMLADFVMFYLGISISEGISPGIFTLISLNVPFAVLMHTTLPLAVNQVTRPPGKRWIDGSIILLAIVELALSYTPLVMRYSAETQSILLGPVYPFVAILQVFLIGYSVGMIALRRKAIVNPAVRRDILTMVVILAVFLPAIAYDQFFYRGAESIDALPATVILSPLFYAVFALASLFFGIRYMMSLATQANGVDSEPEAEEPSQDIRIQELAEKSALSKRELTIIPLIAEGLGNKQIALELNLSSKTVGNHIYNIYRKLGISSRYELLALLK